MAGKRKTGAKPKAKAKPLKAAETPETAETAKAKGGAKAQKKGPPASKVEKSRSKDPVKQEAGRKGGQAGGKTGGRKLGTPNKRTLELREMLEAAGLLDGEKHPVVMMQKIALGLETMPVVVRMFDPENGKAYNKKEDMPLEPALRVKCMSEVAQYLEPKRSALRLDVRRPHDMTDDELDAALKAAIKGE